MSGFLMPTLLLPTGMVPEASATLPQPVSTPFGNQLLPTGVVVLVCSDGARFNVYKNILSLSSAFFRDMLALPQPSDGSHDPTSDGNSADINIPEDSKTIDTLLRLLYPIAPPKLPGEDDDGIIINSQAFVQHVEVVLAAALKYDMPVVVRQLCPTLVQAAERTSNGKVVNEGLALRVFILACKHGLRKEAHIAAHAALRAPLVDVFIPELREITAAQYFQLVLFHKKIADVVVTLTRSKLPSPYDSMVGCAECGKRTNMKSMWWHLFVEEAGPILESSPLSLVPFTPEFTAKILSAGQRCYGSCRDSVYNKWQMLSEYVKDTISLAISKNDIDLSEVI